MCSQVYEWHFEEVALPEQSQLESAASHQVPKSREHSLDTDLPVDNVRHGIDRRTILIGATTATAAVLATPASAAEAPSPDLAAALARFRASIPANFDRDYVEHAVIPYYLSSFYQGERPALPMIDVTLSKENALPFDLWGLLYEGWKPTPEDGVTVFLQGLEQRGDHNLRKRIYFSALTPDLYRPMYGDKVVAFFDELFDARFAGKPFMRHYLDYYFDIYWDLHVGVKGPAIPPQIRTIGESFNTVLAFRDPTQQIVYDNYMTVRGLLPFLKAWIDERVDDVASARVSNPEKTFVYYWLKNAGNGEHFSKKDIVFEVFHNFVALSQWGNTLFGIMSRLARDGGDPDVRAAFEQTMREDFDKADGAYTPLELLVMELFRTISPNGGSISAVKDARTSAYGESPFRRFGLPYERHGYIVTPHTATSFDPRHWENPQQFSPARYKSVPTSAEIDEAKCRQIGFPRCPFEITKLAVKDGRKAELTNSGFGTVFGVADGKPMPVCDYAGFAPFGFGYRRCPGEQLTIKVFADLLRKVWHDKIAFQKLNLSNPGRIPVGPTAVIEDDIGFVRSA
jgi:hypothetical protein